MDGWMDGWKDRLKRAFAVHSKNMVLPVHVN